jgi:uncharacterized 2Fe-2S/4Fe-4S cluster protein (DUF4445 family)
MSEYLGVTASAVEYRIPFTPGLSVREILDTSQLRVRSACGGVGGCGQCRIRVAQGEVTPPTATEVKRLGRGLLQQGWRLACQVRPVRGVCIVVDNPAPPSPWRAFDAVDEPTPLSVGKEAIPGRQGYGVAVDLGTTQIRVSLLDLARGQRLAGRSGLNPQAVFGADVLTRVLAASESAMRALEIGRLAGAAIGEALHDIMAREGVAVGEIRHVVIVGNTAMLCLLAAKNHGLLLLPDHWLREIDCRLEESAEWRVAWGLTADTVVELAPPLAGFVGSDLMAGVLATGLTKGVAGAMLIDFGTNSEMALWDGARLWVTSAAGGPAFEGCGISCGMPAAPGAIYRATMVGTGAGTGAGFVCQVLGGGQAQGLCGSGLVDCVAALVRSGALKPNGRFAQAVGGQGFMVTGAREGITVQGQDIDALQRAKAAIGAGMQCLLAQAGMGLSDLKRLCVCGAFGRHLDLKNAQEIGLLPVMPAAAIELCANTALLGCEGMLLATEGPAVLAPLCNQSRSINLSLVPGFDDLFIENLYLRPMVLR